MSAEGSQLEQYLYDLPEEKIAKHPLDNRDESKLLVYNQGSISHLPFKSIVDQIPEGSTIFLNNTKVIAARLYFFRATGAKIEIFLTEPLLPHPEIQQVLKAQGSCTWKCIIGNLRKWKDDEALYLEFDSHKIEAKLVDRANGIIEFNWTGDITFLDIIESAGHVPLPPYMNREDEISDRDRYQTVFSEIEGAVAAPTAGLHFTDEVLDQIASKGCQLDRLTLHVSAGTFKPITSDDFTDHDMHNERIIISKSNIENILSSQGPVIAIGTTALRTLESLYWYGAKLCVDPNSEFIVSQEDAYQEKYQNISKTAALEALLAKMKELGVNELKGETKIFAYPSYQFKIVEGLSTNFHMPGSTLILLVAAFVGEDWKTIYHEALSNDYRFLSYGDTSLLLPKK